MSRPSFAKAITSDIKHSLANSAPSTFCDYLTPTASHLLDISLAGLLNLPQKANDGFQTCKVLDSQASPILAQGHHLVYFPPDHSTLSLLADGTDTQHFPGPPFTRRMWAGGSVTFLKPLSVCSHSLMACTEEIETVDIKGPEGEEKVFVDVRRTIAPKANTLDIHVHEKKQLVFMRGQPLEEARAQIAGRASKVLKSSMVPDISIKFTPSEALLFRFSALTFNAHRIHLDRQYCQEVEGFKDLVVHGPLTLILMLTVLRAHLEPGEIVGRLHYRNLAPLYVNEEMQICMRRSASRKEKLDVWIEGSNGGFAVKASAIVIKE